MTDAKRARKDRTIRQFTPPYQSPYSDRDFSPAVWNACLANKTGTFGLGVLKMIMVGDASVGKTALIQRFCHGCFPQKYILTVGIEFEVETFCILGVPFKLHIWDTAGEEKFRSIASPYYRGAHVVVIVFDMTNMYSWENVSSWYKEAMRQTGGPVHLFLVGSKKDLCTEQQLVQANELGKRMAQQIQAEYWALSSLTGEDVNAFFFRVVCVAFNAAVSREVEARELEPKKTSMPRKRSPIKLNEPPDFQENPPKRSTCRC